MVCWLYRLPGAVQTSKLARVLKLQILANLGDSIYADELKIYRKKFAAEANVQIALIDMYLLNKDYDQAPGAIDQVDSIFNKDSF